MSLLNFSFNEFVGMSDYSYKYELSFEDGEYWDLIVTIDKLSMFDEEEEEFVKKFDHWEIVNEEFYYITSSEDRGMDDLYFSRGIKKDPKLNELSEIIEGWIPSELTSFASNYEDFVKGFYNSFGVKAIPMFDLIRENEITISEENDKVNFILTITVDKNIFRLWNDNKEYIEEEILYSLEENESITLEVKKSEFEYF